jgi:hypothetical protein
MILGGSKVYCCFCCKVWFWTFMFGLVYDLGFYFFSLIVFCFDLSPKINVWMNLGLGF